MKKLNDGYGITKSQMKGIHRMRSFGSFSNQVIKGALARSANRLRIEDALKMSDFVTLLSCRAEAARKPQGRTTRKI
jgi:hypothetical protein